MGCVFKHKWDGCTCSVCGKTRDQDHDWHGCTCARCGKVLEQAHTWDGCTCTSCGKTRNVLHQWAQVEDQCAWQCARCGAAAPRDLPYGSHSFGESGPCARCGAERMEEAFLRENDRYFLVCLFEAAHGNSAFLRGKDAEMDRMLAHFITLLQAEPFVMAAQNISALNTVYVETMADSALLQAAQAAYVKRYVPDEKLHFDIAARLVMRKAAYHRG